MKKNKNRYESWRIKGSWLNLMLDCGDFYNQWVEEALYSLPAEILDQYKDKLTFIATAQRDACRIGRNICKKREIIVLSTHILPKEGADEGQSEVRYFIYTVLHEVAHVIKKHRPPCELTRDQNAEQEREADKLAFEWFNAHIAELDNQYLTNLTDKEIKLAEKQNQEVMKNIYKGV